MFYYFKQTNLTYKQENIFNNSHFISLTKTQNKTTEDKCSQKAAKLGNKSELVGDKL